MSTHTPSRQPKGLPVGGQFAASARNEAEAVTLASDEAQAADYMAFMDPGAPPEPQTGYCSECGGLWIEDPHGSPGVKVHYDPEGPNGIDHDTDEEHAPVPEDDYRPFHADDKVIVQGDPGVILAVRHLHNNALVQFEDGTTEAVLLHDIDHDDEGSPTTSDAYPNGKCGACGFGLDTAGLCYQHDCSNFDSDSDLADLGSLTSGENLDETNRCWSCHEDGYTTQADNFDDDNGPLCEGCAQRRAEDEADAATDLDETDDEIVTEFQTLGSSSEFAITRADEDDEEGEPYSLYRDGTFIGAFDYDGDPGDHAAIERTALSTFPVSPPAAQVEEFTLTPTLAYRANARWSRDLLAEYAESSTTDPDAADLRATLAVSGLATLTTLRADAAQAAMSDEEKAVVERLDIALKVAEQADLSVEWGAAFAALKASGVAHDADDPIAARYREASNAVNHANRRLDFYIATGQARSTDPVDAAGRLAEALQNALAVGDNHLGA